MFKHARYFKENERPQVPFNSIDEYLDYCACLRLAKAINKKKTGNACIRRNTNKVDSGYVYIAQAVDNPLIFKIGKSVNPASRVKLMGFGHKWSLVKVIQCEKMTETESAMHYVLDPYRKYGELFEIVDFDIIEQAVNSLSVIR